MLFKCYSITTILFYNYLWGPCWFTLKSQSINHWELQSLKTNFSLVNILSHRPQYMCSIKLFRKKYGSWYNNRNKVFSLNPCMFRPSGEDERASTDSGSPLENAEASSRLRVPGLNLELKEQSSHTMKTILINGWMPLNHCGWTELY